MDEGVYEIEIRSLATNDNSDGSKVEEHANLSPSNYAAYKLQLVEVSGRVYDLKVTDIDDPGWRPSSGRPKESLSHRARCFSQVHGT